MSKFVLPENGHLVYLLSCRNLNGGETTDVFSMENYNHADIVVLLGATLGATIGVQIEECDDFTPTTSPGKSHIRYYLETTSTGDTPAAMATLSSTIGLTLAASENSFVVFSIDSAELTDGYENLRLTIRNPAAASLGAAFAVLSGSRYACGQTPTAIA